MSRRNGAQHSILTGLRDPEKLTGPHVCALVGIIIATRLVAAALVPLGTDETYYHLWAQYPAASYLDHPPMVAWWVAGGIWLFGDTPFGTRALFVLSAIPITLAVYTTGKILFSRAAGALAALWINATLLVGVGAISATPDAPSVLFWMLATWAFAMVVATGNGRWWLLAGLFAGLGVAAKLTNLFLGLGFVVAMLVRPDLRRWILSGWTWAGLAMAALALAPVLAWNAQHEWATFAFQFRRVVSAGLSPLFFLEMVGVQFLLLNPPIALFLGLAVIAWLRRFPGYPAGNIALLFWTIMPMVAYMAFHSFRAQIQGNWLAPIFPTLALMAAAAAVAPPAHVHGALRRLAFPLGAALSIVGLVLAANPGGILPPVLDPGSMNRGWPEVARQAAEKARAHDARWIGTTGYGITAAITYYNPDPALPVIGIDQRRRYLFAPAPPDELREARVLLVGERGTLPPLLGCFDEAEMVGEVERRSGAATLDTLVLYLAHGARSTAFTAGCD